MCLKNLSCTIYTAFRLSTPRLTISQRMGGSKWNRILWTGQPNRRPKIRDLSFTNNKCISTYYALFHDIHEILSLMRRSQLELATNIRSVSESMKNIRLHWLSQEDDNTERKEVIGVYGLLLEKEGAQSNIYIGSGSRLPNGSKERIEQQRRKILCPETLRDAYKDGYELNNIRVLCCLNSGSMKEDQGRLRNFIVILESVFTIIFNAIQESRKEYDFAFSFFHRFRSCFYHSSESHSLFIRFSSRF